MELPPGQWERAWISLRRRDVLGRIGLALVAAAAICCVIRAWDPPFSYRIGHVPMRNIVARVEFTQVDPDATRDDQQKARNGVRYIFVQDPKPLEHLRASLYNTVAAVDRGADADRVEPGVVAEVPAAAGRRRRGAADTQPRRRKSSNFRRFGPPWPARRTWPAFKPR